MGPVLALDDTRLVLKAACETRLAPALRSREPNIRIASQSAPETSGPERSGNPTRDSDGRFSGHGDGVPDEACITVNPAIAPGKVDNQDPVCQLGRPQAEAACPGL
jgi:hypothetical protein